MRFHHIVLGAAAGVGIAFLTLSLFGTFERGSIAWKLFWGLHWPETVTVDWLTMKYYPHNTDQGLRFLLPVHFGYWAFLGVSGGIIYSLAGRARERSTAHENVIS